MPAFFSSSLRPWLAALALATSVAASAQGDVYDLSPEQSGRPRVPAAPAAIAAVPEGYRFVKPGELTIAIAPSTPPLSTYATDAKTVVGADVDIAQLVADSLGLQLRIVPVAWADWPLGLSSGKYDAVISNVGVTEQRKEKFDFSTYREGLHGFFVALDSPVQSIKEPKDAAGLRIIVGSGTNQERILLEWSKQNVATGLKPLDLQYYDDEPARLLALRSRRADVIVQPHAQLLFIESRDRNVRRVGVLSAGWPLKSDVAIATRKDSGLAPALTLAINELIKTGKYREALARWRLEDEALERSETNPPGLPKF
ncbi:ABC transporter substrate-binding protein [Terrarubrum flagellatum]|uniref:ABC transporter substrate-binding protein n=1 Tax=Terrirubrum flagellatum TaxID=2895980 RepID=UPI0031450689